MQLREVLKGDEELGVGGRAVGGEGTVGRSESCDRGAVTGRGCPKIHDGFDRFVLVEVVGRLIGVVARLENGSGCGRLRLTPFLVCRGKKFLEAVPGLDVRWLVSPYLEVVVKKTSLKHELESDSNDLGWGVGHVPCGGVVNRIFDLINQGLDRLIAVVGSTEPLVVVLESGDGNVIVGRIEMI